LTACPGYVDISPEPMVTAYEPIMMSRSQLEASISMKEPQPVSSPGKLYKYGHYILINELYKGVHIIDNQNPASPQNVAFVQVPGNVDIAVKNNVLYVDNAVDLVALDLSDVNNIQAGSRIRNAFPKLLPPDGLTFNMEEAGVPKDAVIIGWKLKEE
ncbi:MAG TPA: hypothetical protein VK927_03955, partial [Adhaeribacter sp.]|nr:hypothetical protein [Adhaeribacter sp.]